MFEVLQKPRPGSKARLVLKWVYMTANEQASESGSRKELKVRAEAEGLQVHQQVRSEKKLLQGNQISVTAVSCDSCLQ